MTSDEQPQRLFPNLSVWTRLISVKVYTVSFSGTGLFCFSVKHFGFKRAVEIICLLGSLDWECPNAPMDELEEGGLCISVEAAARDPADKSLALNWMSD